MYATMYLPCGNFSGVGGGGRRAVFAVLAGLPALVASPSHFMIKDMLCLLLMGRLSPEDLSDKRCQRSEGTYLLPETMNSVVEK